MQSVSSEQSEFLAVLFNTSHRLTPSAQLFSSHNSNKKGRLPHSLQRLTIPNMHHKAESPGSALLKSQIKIADMTVCRSKMCRKIHGEVELKN